MSDCNEEISRSRSFSGQSTAFANVISIAQKYHHNSVTHDLEPLTGWYGWMTTVVQHSGFTIFINTVIIISAVQMGIQANNHNSRPEYHLLRDIAENMITAIFAIEMVMRALVLGQKYFRGFWNVFDGFIALTSIIYVWILPLAGQNSNDTDLSIIRVFRLLRLFRVLKLMKAVPQFRMLMEGIVASMQALFWVCLMVAVTVYTFAIFCVEIIGDADATVYPGYSNNTLDIEASISSFNNFEYFGDLGRAMLSLLSISLLAEWSAIRPVWEFQSWCLPVIFVLVFITSFGFVNVIIGVIVESTTESMQEMHSHTALDSKNRQMEKIRSLAEIIWQLDSNGDGKMTKHEMRSIGEDAEICLMLENLGLPKGFTFDELFTMLNVHGKEALEKTDFVIGMERLIFSTDFQKACLQFTLMGQVQTLHRDLQRMQTTLLSDFKIMHKEILESINATGHPVVAKKLLASTSCPEAGFDSHSWPDSPVRVAADELVVSPTDVNPHVAQCNTAAASFLPAISNDVDLKTVGTPTHVRFNLGSTEEI